MLLITMHEWFGPGRGMPPEERARTTVQETHTAFATRRQLGEALRLIHGYEKAYNDRYRLAVNFTLLTVAQIEDLGEYELFECGRVRLAEELPQSVDAF